MRKYEGSRELWEEDKGRGHKVSRKEYTERENAEKEILDLEGPGEVYLCVYLR